MNDKRTFRTRHGKDNPYFAVSRTTAQDDNLSFEARGMLMYLLSKPDDWRVVKKDLQNNGDIGRDKADRILNELLAAGYIQKDKQTKNSDGTFNRVTYRVYETPQTESPCTENPCTVEPGTETTPTYIRERDTEDRSKEKDSATAMSVAGNQPLLPMYAKPAKPGNLSDKQYANLRPVYALAAAMGRTVVDADIPLYKKEANKLQAENIDFVEYLNFIRTLSKRQGGWDITITSLTANGRMSEYLSPPVAPARPKVERWGQTDPNVVYVYGE